eukprot:7641982-Pyramimonas_sp.AAC.1
MDLTRDLDGYLLPKYRVYSISYNIDHQPYAMDLTRDLDEPRVSLSDKVGVEAHTRRLPVTMFGTGLYEQLPHTDSGNRWVSTVLYLPRSADRLEAGTSVIRSASGKVSPGGTGRTPWKEGGFEVARQVRPEGG